MRLVLTYHSIDVSRSVISTSPAAFRQQMEWLARSDAVVTSLESIVSENPPGDAVAITFDDGYENFLESALPVLRDMDLPSTVFVISGHVGGHNEWDANEKEIPVLPLMDWTGLEVCSKSGVIIGAHGRTHRRLTALSASELEDDLSGCAADIAVHIGRRPNALAYPYGDVDDAVRAAASRSFTRACTTELRALTDDDSPHAIPRVDAYYLRGPGRIEGLGTPRFAAWLKVRSLARQLR